jgi:4-aminobutyrate aminotransferase-like enzyme
MNVPHHPTTLAPDVRVPPPGPRSRHLAGRLGSVECPDTTYLGESFPVFWERAAGVHVWDVDGNRYVDLTAAFGVAALGHGHPRVVAAVRAQAKRLLHGMGDVHPTELKVQLAERLQDLAPGDLGCVLFGCTGSDAVEAALKTAAIATGRPGILAFTGAYHGLGYGALAACGQEYFRAPFAAQLNPHAVCVPFPDPRRRPLGGRDAATEAARALERVDAALAARDEIGAVIAEPIQGRGGIVIPHASFLPGLREICTRRSRLLVADEILTGLGRTGRWFACEHAGVVPDLLCVGKALGGGLPISACIGRHEIMAAWGQSTGEARHTSTFLGNPLAAAASLATLDVLAGEDWPAQVRERGRALGDALAAWRSIAGVADVRGAGLLWGVELETEPGQAPDPARAFAVVCAALRRGVLVLADGADRNVLALTPPFILAGDAEKAALEALHAALVATAPGGAAAR